MTKKKITAQECTRYMVRRTSGDNGSAFAVAVTTIDPADRNWTFYTFGQQRGLTVIRNSMERAERDAWALHLQLKRDPVSWTHLLKRPPMLRSVA